MANEYDDAGDIVTPDDPVPAAPENALAKPSAETPTPKAGPPAPPAPPAPAAETPTSVAETPAAAAPRPMPSTENWRNWSADDYRAALRNENIQRGLFAIRSAEGTQRFDNPYAVAFGGRRIADLTDHPRTAYPFRNPQAGPNATTAAGAYQFLTRTWDAAARRLGLNNFGPENQDIAALYLIANRGGLGALTRGDVSSFADAVRGEWASVPGAPYGQPTRSLRQFAGYFGQDGAQKVPDYAALQKGVGVAGPRPVVVAGGATPAAPDDSNEPSDPFAPTRPPARADIGGPFETDRAQGAGAASPYGSDVGDPPFGGDSPFGGDPLLGHEQEDEVDNPFDNAPTRGVGFRQPQSRGQRSRAKSTTAAQAYAQRFAGLDTSLFGGG